MLLGDRCGGTLYFQGAVCHHLTTLYMFTTLGIIPVTFCTKGTTMDTRVQLLRDWMAREERGTVWVAKKVGRTKAYVSNILHDRMGHGDAISGGHHRRRPQSAREQGHCRSVTPGCG